MTMNMGDERLRFPYKSAESETMFENVQLYNQGLAEGIGELKFSSGKGELSNFSAEGDEVIQMTSLDSLIGNGKIGYIKLDIEGFERKALLGSKTIISRQRPALGISIYHKREDIWDLPKLILSMNPEYRFFLRHYSLSVVDTVLYAI